MAPLSTRRAVPSWNRLPVATMTRLDGRRSARPPLAWKVFGNHGRRGLILTHAGTRVYDTRFLTDTGSETRAPRGPVVAITLA